MAVDVSLPQSGSPDVAIGRLGVFGGTFDPIHVGHLIIAEEARARFNLDRVVFVPALHSPLKSEGTLFPARDRLRMTELAVADNPRFAVSRVDIDRQGPSYTVDTLRQLRSEYGMCRQLFFIMGMDSLRTLARWHKPEEIIRLTRIVVFTRPGWESDWAAIQDSVPGLSRVTDVISTVNIGISSTDIRARLMEGLPIRYQVPASVETFISSSDVVLEPTRSQRICPCC